MSIAPCPIAVVSTLTIAPTDRAAAGDVPLRVRIEAADASTEISVRLFAVGGEITARALRYSARSDVLWLTGRAELALRASPGVVSFQSDDPRAAIRVTVEDWSGRTIPLEASGHTVMLVRTAAGVELQVVNGVEPKLPEPRVA